MKKFENPEFEKLEIGDVIATSGDESTSCPLPELNLTETG